MIEGISNAGADAASSDKTHQRQVIEEDITAEKERDWEMGFQASLQQCDETLSAAADELLAVFRKTMHECIPIARAITQSEITVLMHLSSEDHQTSPALLADYIGVTRPRVTQILDSLEQNGLVMRVKNTKDARRVTIELTAEGRAIYKRYNARSKEVARRFLVAYGVDSAQELIDVFNKSYAIIHSSNIPAMAQKLSEVPPA